MPKSAPDFNRRGGGPKVRSLPNQNAQRLEQAAHALNTKTGFSLTPAVTISFVDGSRTFTITPDGSTFDYWIQGVKYTKSVAESVVITDTEGLWYIYYVGGTLTASQTLWVTRDGDKAFVATVHWDATNNIAIIIGYECHSHDMLPGTHNYLHETIGTNYENGLSLTEGAGGDAGKIGISEGEVHDEDIEIIITDGAGGSLWEQVLTLPAQIPVYYRSGASAWRKYTANDYPWYDNSGVDGIHYNKLNGTWASAEATNPYYVAYWLFATNDIAEPIVAIMGQREDLLLNDALDNNQIENLSFGTLPFSEMKILYRLIWKSSTAPAVADDIEDMQSVSNVPGGTYVPTPTPSLSQVVAVGGELISGQVITLGASTSIRSDGTPADATYTGDTMSIDTTGCATYDAVYIDGANSVLPAKADAIGTLPAIGIVVSANVVLTKGIVRSDASWAISAGTKVYVSAATAGELISTAPTGTGNIIQEFGEAVGNDMILVNPSFNLMLDEDDLVSDSALIGASQQSIKAYISAAGADPEGIASDDLIFSNDTPRSYDESDATYRLAKEITVYRKMNVRVYWEFKVDYPGELAYSKVYVNDIAVGVEQTSPNSISFDSETEDIGVEVGDKIQIYAHGSSTRYVYSVQNLRLKLIEYIANASY